MTHLEIGICCHILCHIICPVPGSAYKVSQTKIEYCPTDIRFPLPREMGNCETETLMVAHSIHTWKLSKNEAVR